MRNIWKNLVRMLALMAIIISFIPSGLLARAYTVDNLVVNSNLPMGTTHWDGVFELITANSSYKLNSVTFWLRNAGGANGTVSLVTANASYVGWPPSGGWYDIRDFSTSELSTSFEPFTLSVSTGNFSTGALAVGVIYTNVGSVEVETSSNDTWTGTWGFGTGNNAQYMSAHMGGYWTDFTTQDMKFSFDYSYNGTNGHDTKADFNWSPELPEVGDNITFDASNSTAPGQIVSYYWEFGDDTTANTTSTNVSHIYQNTGDYTVNLTVTDNTSLSDNISKPVSVWGYSHWLESSRRMDRGKRNPPLIESKN